MVNPVPGHKITTAYRKKGALWSLGWHTGADFAATVGTKIVSATPGRVIAANAYDSSYGYKVIIRWGKYDVWYCHMRKGYATVKVGQTVKAGQQIGKVGDVGNITGPHLHMELRNAGAGFAASSFNNPSIAINYQEDDMPTLEEIWTYDRVPVLEGVASEEARKANPNWTPLSALAVMLRQGVESEARDEALMEVVKQLAIGQGIDPEAIEAAAQRGAEAGMKKALESIEVTISAGSESGN